MTSDNSDAMPVASNTISDKRPVASNTISDERPVASDSGHSKSGPAFFLNDL